MNKKNYIDKIELILNTSSKYITRKEKDMILDYVNYFKTKNNVIEDKNIELVIEIERLNNIINELDKQKEVLDKALFVLEHIEDDRAGYEAIKEILKGSDKEC